MKKTIMGWREWVSLPQLNITAIKAKIDTGAKTSSLHAFNISEVIENGKPVCVFEIHPLQDDDSEVVQCKAPLVEWRNVKSSSGHEERRPVIQSKLAFLNQKFDILLTLTNRDTMGFRMLLGREALAPTVIVDPALSFYLDNGN